MAMYQVDGWEGLVPFADLQNYLDTAQLYADNWVCEVPDLNSLGWITLGDALLPAKKIVDFADGTRVEGLYSDGTWYPGTVQGKNPSGSFLVAFDAYAGYPPEPCSEIRLEGSDTAKATTPTPVEAAPVAPVAPVAPLPTPTTSSTTEKVWHILAGESGETTGPFSIDELSEQLRDGLALTNTSMIHETGTEWVTVGSVATAAPAASSAGSAKQFAAAQTRKKQGGHVRKVSKVTVFQQPPRKKSIERTGSRSAPVKSGSSTYGGDKNKYDEDGAMVICQWIETIIDRPLAGSAAEFIEVLQNECTIFSELFGAFGQGETRKVKKSKMRFKKLENIKAFLQACKGILDMDDIILFSANDLLDGKNIDKCLGCIAEFAKRMLKEFKDIDPAERPPSLVVSLKSGVKRNRF